ncbi:MAG: MFS transporter [Chloroflexota bacterium]
MLIRGYAENPGYRWFVLAVVYFCVFAMGLVFQGIPPILSLIMADLSLTHAEAGLLMSAFALPGIVLSAVAGMLGDRYGPKNVVVVALAFTVVGSLIVAGGWSFPAMALGRMLSGIGGASLFVLGAQLMSQWFAGRGLGMAVGIYSTATPFGAIVSMNTMGGAAEAIGWRGAILVGVALCALGLALFVAIYRPPGAKATRMVAEGISRSSRYPSLRMISRVGLPIWLVGTIWALYNGATTSFITFAPDYFAANGASIRQAGFLASIVMLLSPPVAPLVGYLLDRLGREETIIATGGLLAALSIFLVSVAGPSPILPLVLLGLGTAMVPTSIMALTSKTVSPEHVGTGYGIAVSCLNVGVVVGPFIVGLIRQTTGSYQLGFYAMSCFAVSVALVTVVLHAVRRRAAVGRASIQKKPTFCPPNLEEGGSCSE